MSDTREEEGLAKRIAHKLHRKHDKEQPDDKENGKPLHDKPNPHPRHHRVEGYERNCASLLRGQKLQIPEQAYLTFSGAWSRIKVADRDAHCCVRA